MWSQERVNKTARVYRADKVAGRTSRPIPFRSEQRQGTAFPRSSGRAIENWFGSPASPSDASTAGVLVTVDDRRQRAFVLGYQVMDHHECHPGCGRQGFRCAVDGQTACADACVRLESFAVISIPADAATCGVLRDDGVALLTHQVPPQDHIRSVCSVSRMS